MSLLTFVCPASVAYCEVERSDHVESGWIKTGSERNLDGGGGGSFDSTRIDIQLDRVVYLTLIK